MKQNDSRLDAVMDRLSDIPGDAAGAADRAFEKASGELLIRAGDAPDRDDYDDVNDGYRRYLNDCHEWARDEYLEAVADLEWRASQLEQTARQYPDFGDYSNDAADVREDEADWVEMLAESYQETAAARSRLKRIEQEIDG